MSKYSIRAREFGRGKGNIHRFSTLAELQTYVRGQWQGVEYVDSPSRFHSDYCTFDLSGATLRDLGKRMGERGTDQYWEWLWHDLSILERCQHCGCSRKEHGVKKPFRCASRLTETYWTPWTLEAHERAVREGDDDDDSDCSPAGPIA